MSVVLAADVGNTSVAWRLMVASGRWAGQPQRAAAGQAAKALLAAAQAAGVTEVVCVSSAPSIFEAIEKLLRGSGFAVLLAERDFSIPIETAYYDRREIGRDRLCNALAARELSGAPCVSCSVGTCITVEAVDASGVVAGGAISAGLPALRAGVETTARHLGAALENAAASPPSQIAPGRSTAENLRLGIWLQAAAAVERLVEMARAAVGDGAPVILTGGDASAVARLCREDFRIEPFLTLEGLRIAYLTAEGRQ